MVLNEEMLEHLRRQVLESSAPEWETVEELNRMSLEKLWSVDSHSRVLRSTGIIRISGAAAVFGEALISSAGNVLINFQNLVTATGASLEGIRSRYLSDLPRQLVALTELRLLMRPLPGSLILKVTPAMSPMDELSAEEYVLVHQERTQFIDRCVYSTMELLRAAHTLEANIDNSEFLERVTNGGPLLATTLKKFAVDVEKDDFDINLEWSEPEVQTARAVFTKGDAALVKSLIVSRELDQDPVALTGYLVTLSTESRWQLTLDDGSQVTIDPTIIRKDTDVTVFHLKQRVKIKANAIAKIHPGGATTILYKAVSIEAIDE